MTARTWTFYDADGNALKPAGAMTPRAYFEAQTGLTAGRFIKGEGYVYGYLADGTKAAAHRVVAYKNRNPSRHKCGARCRNAKGPACECACGGEFHGADS